MIKKNIICIESSLSIKEVIDSFIQEEKRESIVQYFENQKVDTSKESILLYDNFTNQPLPKELLANQNVIVVRLTDFVHWEKISSIEVTERINSLFKKGEVCLYANLN